MDTTDDTLLEEDARAFLDLIGKLRSIKLDTAAFAKKLGMDLTDEHILRVVNRAAFIWGHRTAGGSAFWYGNILQDARHQRSSLASRRIGTGARPAASQQRIWSLT
jgi:hypothetical protein